MFSDIAKFSVQGFIKITDKDSGEVLLDTHNDVLYGNMSSAMAHALLGNTDSLLFYLGFGDGSAYLNGLGDIVYKPSLGGPASIVKNPTANLYNTIYVKKLANDSTPTADFTETAQAFIPAENFASNNEDIIVSVTVEGAEPPTGISPTSNLVFNEIALYAGSNNLFPGPYTQTTAEVASFVAQIPNFTNTATSKSKIMLTHVIFEPITKTSAQNLVITYTLRIQMGNPPVV